MRCLKYYINKNAIINNYSTESVIDKCEHNSLFAMEIHNYPVYSYSNNDEFINYVLLIFYIIIDFQFF